MKASHAIATWALQKRKPNIMSHVQIADNDITEPEIRRVGRIVLLDHFWARAIESLDGVDGGFLSRKYEFMTVVCACISTTPKDSRCLLENPSVTDFPLTTRASQKATGPRSRTPTSQGTVKSRSPSCSESSQSRVVKPRITRLVVTEGDENITTRPLLVLGSGKEQWESSRKSIRQ